jgi:predicted O-methyltransferase YrrM/SAM-dependent methyltransferase
MRDRSKGWAVSQADPAMASLSALQRAALERGRALTRLLTLGERAGGVHAEYDPARDASGKLGRLADESVDLFSAGEALDRIEDTERFLDEIHRVLRPGGFLVATACNADAYLLARSGMRWGTRGDRAALMSHQELCALLAPRFDVVAARGFNASVHPSLDAQVTDHGFASAWAASLEDRPDLATNVVLLARRRAGWRPGRTRTDVLAMDDPRIDWQGPWQTVALLAGVDGRLGSGGDASTLTVDVDGTDLLVFLWTHPWGGRVLVEVDGVVRRVVGLYEPAQGFRRAHVDGLTPGRHRLRVRGSRARLAHSAGDQVIVTKVIAYEDPGKPAAAGEERFMDGEGTFAIRPARFGVVYTTPAHMTAAERVYLYGLVFALRPQRTIEIGTFRGGSALIIGAALDDVGAGTLVCIDPVPQVAQEHWALVAHRATLLAEPSPAAVAHAAEVAGGPFDFALIDGDHTQAGVVRDVEGVLPFLAPDAHLLFHDAHYFEVADAIDRMLVEHADRLSDCGMVSTERTPESRSIGGRQVVWGGLRMLRHHRSP